MNQDFNQTLKNLSQVLAKDLQAVNELILTKMDSDVPLISQIAQHLIKAGGKRIRPLLTILAYKMFSNNNNNKYLLIAACVEFIHSATLLHDDVVDENESRRSIPTSNHIWGNKSSVLVGDFLFSKAFELMVATESLEVLQILSRASSVIAQGEVLQLMEINNIHLSLATYNKIIYSKTASLFGAATQVGALIAGADMQDVQTILKFGENLGMVFQITDDVLDYQSQDNILGKSIGTDFKEGKITLPIILLLQKANENEKSFLVRTFQEVKQKPEDFQELLTYLNKYDVFAEIQNIKKDYMDQTLTLMKSIKVNNIYKNICLDLIESSTQRNF
ncbi:Octaprenyl diphosphate synthase [Candidatus Hepatincola sp. Av]